MNFASFTMLELITMREALKSVKATTHITSSLLRHVKEELVCRQHRDSRYWTISEEGRKAIQASMPLDSPVFKVRDNL